MPPSPLESDTDSEESQNYEHDLQSFAWQNIDIDENKPALMRVIEEIINSAENIQITEAAMLVSEISMGIKANMLPLCPLAPITNPRLFSGYKTTRRTSGGLQAALQSWSSYFGGHTRNQSITH